MGLLTVIFYPLMATATATAAGAYMWYYKPGTVISLMLKTMMYNCGLRVHSVQGKKYRYCYAVRGQRKPHRASMLLIHGFSASKDNWVALVKRFPKDLHIVALDLLGHGDTTLPAESEHVDIPDLVHCIEEFVELTDLNTQPFHIIGTSMGGLLAALYTSQNPDKVAKVTLICPGMKTPVQTAFMQKMTENHKDSILLPTTQEEMHTMMTHCMYDKTKVISNKQFLKGILQLRQPKHAFHERLFAALQAQNSGEGSEEKFKEFMSKITPPTQIIWGQEDELIHVSGVEVLRSILPNIKEVHILENCGHTTHFEKAKDVAKLILTFNNSDTTDEEKKSV